MSRRRWKIRPQLPQHAGCTVDRAKLQRHHANRHVRHTFKWDGCKQNKCCEIYKAKLVVTVKALTDGQSHESTDAGNDSISIWKNGSVQHWQYLYSPTPVTAGTIKTFTIPVQPSWLDGCRLSFQIQDDSALLDAKLVATGCCVKPNFKP